MAQFSFRDSLSLASRRQDPIQPINRPIKDVSLNPPAVAAPFSKPVVMITPSQTPIQPGLSLPQDFPPLVAPQPPPPAPSRHQRKITTTAIKPVIPVLPNPSSKPTPVQKDPQPSEKADKTEPGIPSVPEASMKPKPKEDEAFSSLPEVRTTSKAIESSPAISSKPVDKKSRPSKLDIAAAKDATKKDKESIDTAETTSGPVPSQPPTPATAVSQASASSATRPNQSRAFRVPPLPKAEIRPASPATAPAITSRQASRRPSIASIERPGSPASEKYWDNMSLASTTFSRAGSPPPSRVGSAPVRHFTKSQQKKERQTRAKQAEEASKIEEPPTKVEEPMQAPIIGRKKKAKKEKTQGTSDSTPTVTRPTSPVPKEEEAVDEKAEPVTPVRDGKKTSSRIVADIKEPDTPSSPATPASNDPQKALLTAASIFASLLKSGELSSTVSELFKSVPGLNYRFEGLELDLAVTDDSMVSESQMHSLDQGEAITIQKSPTNHVVVLPDRSALRGLSAVQAGRYLELRKQALANGDVPSNQALASLVPVLPQVSLPVARFTSRTSSEDQKLPNHFAAPTSGPTPLIANLQKYGAMEAPGDEGFLKKIPGNGVEDAEQALSLSRKETEIVEKRLNTLLKKNRRLVFGNTH
ncbi:MAG: hypothetical protein Q9161_004368 [Pseudevernia consocians]